MQRWQRLYLVTIMLALIGSTMFGCQLAQDTVYTGFRALHFGMTAEAALSALALEPSAQSAHAVIFEGLTGELATAHDRFGIDRPYRLTLGLRAELTEPSVHRIEVRFTYDPDEAADAKADFEKVVAQLRKALAAQRYAASGDEAEWTKGPYSVTVQLTPTPDDGRPAGQQSLTIVTERDYASPISKDMAIPS